MTDIQESLREMMECEGALAASVVDYLSRITLGAVQTSQGPNLEKVAYGDTDVLRAKLSTLEFLGYSPERLEDIVVTLDTEYHLIRPLSQRASQGVFLYLVADRTRVDLDAARATMRDVALRLDV
ncbi:hypothetical protein [Streptomyces rapamycinicus]|uniref:Uncharacterized protein n=2 Tax=Streptomyces rapamycinicus TaxID=1226757 RepID=A0A0A0N834_STRRN|nr:hypothetical protein [Streptomyces rapamycinicus]AGP52794.1 hypothetical protein M271_05840 [Streptomyces rapamycinicus NRRL 5491]MBB4780269.1 hypothetical protein [Streptomyces rapamycinicus]RLV75076.1 hypothetical protein D3C57_137660 [Streptomyces rapamycinicus NRRL 5491]UTO61004.1 hypothetical protein LJB45_00880 [Streptomyces rapamycinicus]UTP28948.1 hypothetical protein LIV37_06000 [Streptomyces rapamycinicus NRRL 5491]